MRDSKGCEGVECVRCVCEVCEGVECVRGV